MEVRKAKRIRLDLPIEIQSGDAQRSGILHDLSLGGCAFYHDVALDVGKRLQVRIHLDQSLSQKFKKSQLTARGAVIRCVPKGKGFLITLRFQPAREKFQSDTD